jgi:hypothetical protein
LLRRDLTLVIQIGLVSHQHNNNIISSFTSYVVYPFPCVLEGFRICDPLAEINAAREEGHYLRYRILPQPRWNLECMKGSDFGIFPVLLYPIIVTVPFCLRGTWSATQSDLFSDIQGYVSYFGEEIDTDRSLVHVVKRVVHEPCD